MSDLKDPLARSPKSKLMLISLFCLPLIGVGFYAFYSRSQGGSKQDLPHVDWSMYRKFEIAAGKAPPELQAFDGRMIKTAGFMVPLEDNRSEVTEFLLVPNPQACIHVPPPPANQMVYVRMVKNPAKAMFGPIWVEGTLRIAAQSHQYGSASFQIYGENVEAFREN